MSFEIMSFIFTFEDKNDMFVLQQVKKTVLSSHAKVLPWLYLIHFNKLNKQNIRWPLYGDKKLILIFSFWKKSLLLIYFAHFTNTGR